MKIDRSKLTEREFLKIVNDTCENLGINYDFDNDRSEGEDSCGSWVDDYLRPYINSDASCIHLGMFDVGEYEDKLDTTDIEFVLTEIDKEVQSKLKILLNDLTKCIKNNGN